MTTLAVVRVVVFDFDGTLADTNQAKRDAYATVLAGLGIDPELCSRTAAELRQEDRYGVIRVILERWRGNRPADGEVDRLAAAYGDICERAAIDRPEMPGAVDALATLNQTCAAYVNSATPEVSLRRIVHARGWDKYFRDVLGRPRTKVENLRAIIAREAVTAADVIMVGDGVVDRDAADEVGTGFVAAGLFPASARRPGERWVDDLRQLPPMIAAAPARA